MRALQQASAQFPSRTESFERETGRVVQVSINEYHLGMESMLEGEGPTRSTAVREEWMTKPKEGWLSGGQRPGRNQPEAPVTPKEPRPEVLPSLLFYGRLKAGRCRLDCMLQMDQQLALLRTSVWWRWRGELETEGVEEDAGEESCGRQ